MEMGKKGILKPRDNDRENMLQGEGAFENKTQLFWFNNWRGGVIIIFGYYFASEERSVPVYCVATIANEGSEFKGEIFIRALCCYSHK